MARRRDSRFDLNKLVEARLDFDRAHEIDRTDPYPVLWRAILDFETSGIASPTFKDAALTMDQGKWPWPICCSDPGQSSMEETDRAARTGDPSKISGQECEANFYIGQKLSSMKDVADGRRRLAAAVGDRPGAFLESTEARIALSRLGGEKHASSP